MGCLKRSGSSVRQELRLSNVWFHHDEPHRFVCSEWQKQPFVGVQVWYVLYRWAWALYHIAWEIVSFLNEGSGSTSYAYHFIYLTNWSYICICVMTTVQAVVVQVMWHRYRQTAQLPKTTTPSLKVVWVLQNMVYLPALLITSAYWTAIYEPGSGITAINADIHIINSVYALIDLMVVAAPTRILHFYIPFVYLFIYMVFSLIYWAVGGTTPGGGTAIYPILDWDNLGVTLPFIVCCAVFSPLMQAVVWLIYRLRVWLRRACCGSPTLVSLPHQGTMDDIIGRDASLESVENPLPPQKITTISEAV